MYVFMHVSVSQCVCLRERGEREGRERREREREWAKEINEWKFDETKLFPLGEKNFLIFANFNFFLSRSET